MPTWLAAGKQLRPLLVMERAHYGEEERLGSVGRWAELKRLREAAKNTVTVRIPNLTEQPLQHGGKCAVDLEKGRSEPRHQFFAGLHLDATGVSTKIRSNGTLRAGAAQQRRQREPFLAVADLPFGEEGLDESSFSSRNIIRNEEATSRKITRSLLTICRYLEDGDISTALHLIRRTNFASPLKELMIEVQKRLMLTVLRMVQRSYVFIRSVKLAEFLDIDAGDDLQKILKSAGWREENGYIKPELTHEFMHLMQGLNNLPTAPTPKEITREMIKKSHKIIQLIVSVAFMDPKI
ncbi:unnamed protein product [Gongylonema pulchrum]|uniref:CSN8_PSD8_EIF3K domain-containing protein n=1 Tax=Gongylonema pulchrum TaxID=637853 RepID=A0A183DN49_9BILA|nr:unnamed protein product [Gongylonema pulchrum]